MLPPLRYQHLIIRAIKETIANRSQCQSNLIWVERSLYKHMAVLLLRSVSPITVVRAPCSENLRKTIRGDFSFLSGKFSPGAFTVVSN